MRSPEKRSRKPESAVESGVSLPAHTPGPWEACKDGACSCRQVWSIPGDVPVFTARPDINANIGMAHHKWGDSPELLYGVIPLSQAEANARLIAAAPELLDFVQKQYDSTNCICHLNRIGGTDVPCTRCEAAALLAKAGRAPADGLPPLHFRSLCPKCEGTGRHRYCSSGLDEDETGYETCSVCGGSGLAKAGRAPAEPLEPKE